MAGFIRNLKNPFTGNFIFPVTKTRAVYDDNGNRLDYYLESMKSIAGNNLLINSNFANPVNQRGVTFPFSGSDEYFIDRWWVNNHVNYVKKTSKGIILTSGSVSHGLMRQTIEDSLIGQCVTLSAKINGKILQMTCEITGDTNEAVQEGNAMLAVICEGTYTTVDIISVANTSIEIEWIKLEYGKVATQYAPRLYAEELQLCKRYYQVLNQCNGGVLVYFDQSCLAFNLYGAVQMRSKPTPVLGEVNVRANTVTISDFTYTVVMSPGDSSINPVPFIKCEKASHGLSYEDCLSINAVVHLDAEL